MESSLETARTRVGQSVRELLVGQSHPSARRQPSSDGLFGPESVTRRVHGDPAMLIGGVRALLLQTLHPPTMAGVADHSDYRTDPLGRLHRTGRFVGTTTFGSRS